MENIKELIKYILKINDLGWLEGDANLLFTILGVFSFVGGTIYKFLLYIKKRRDIKQALKNIPYFTENEIERAIKYYVETKCQSVSPSIANEPSQPYAFVPKEKTIPFFINKAFKSKKDDFKFYIVLADSGMGKTTFLINLLLRYRKSNSSIVRYLAFQDETYDIKLIPLGMPDAIDEINKIEDNKKSQTILLLDAFDEDNEAVLDYKTRLDEILEAIKKFKEVVITCRTQFFPSEQEEPHKTGLFKYGGDKGRHEFKKLYISPFDDEDINKYINRKYPFWNFIKRKKAKEIVSRSPNLMVRPMLLNYIDDFINHKNQKPKYYTISLFGNILFKIPYYEVSFSYTYQIYELLIEKWIDREASRTSENDNFKAELYKFSKQIAVNIYENRFERGGLFIDYQQIAEFARVNNIQLEQLEMTSRSLLNRDAEGRYKFSHRSILEYFLAIEALDNQRFLSTFNFDGMENVKLFLGELGINKYLSGFFKNYPNSNIQYCTSDGLIGTIDSKLPLSLNFLNNINFISFDDILFNYPETRQVILSFPSLKIFSKDKKNIIDFYSYKILNEKEENIISTLNDTTININLEHNNRLKSTLNKIQEDKRVLNEKFEPFKHFEQKLEKFLSGQESTPFV